MRHGEFHIGCAGWAIPRPQAALFPSAGSHLARYAQRFNAVEINSSFYRPHRRTTYERWAATVPDHFAFAVKVPREITHAPRLSGADAALAAFLAQVGGLGDRLGPLLFQLPPRLGFDAAGARALFAALRSRFDADAVCEPRHAGWFTAEADALLAEFRIARVAADPPLLPAAAEPGGWNDLAYYRLHGSPRLYYSDYGPERLDGFARRLADAARRGRRCWCIFDNTAAGAATANALALQARLAEGGA
jgi:uncharacterized protein YecE (DUF72 family)